MKDQFLIKSTPSTPQVLVNYSEGIVDIQGKSSPENTLEFYQRVFKAIAYFKRRETEGITANFQFVYFNTSSARCIFMMIKELKKLEDLGRKVTINWFVEDDDEDMMETGLDFQDIVDIDFQIQFVQTSLNY